MSNNETKTERFAIMALSIVAIAVALHYMSLLFVSIMPACANSFQTLSPEEQQKCSRFAYLLSFLVKMPMAAIAGILATYGKLLLSIHLLLIMIAAHKIPALSLRARFVVLVLLIAVCLCLTFALKYGFGGTLIMTNL